MKPMTAFASPTSSLLWFDLPGAPEFKLLVLRQGDQVHAFANRCARFAWATGACEAGECDGEALIAVPIDHDNGVLRIGVAAPPSTRTS